MRATIVYALSMHLISGAPGERTAVIDGDSLSVGGQSIRLFGIDAPEWHQACALPDGTWWYPGQEAARALRELAEGKTVTCREKDRDSHGRIVATCTVGRLDLSRAQVQAGWAVAYTRYSDKYVKDEAKAKAARIGLWRGNCQSPETWRMDHSPRRKK